MPEREVERGSDRPQVSSAVGLQGALTEAEFRALSLTGDLARLLDDVVADGPTREEDLREAVHHVHAVQNMLLAQAAARCYPGHFRLLGEASDPARVLPTANVTPRTSRHPEHPHGSEVEQVHRVITTDQGVDAWVLAEEAVAFVRERVARDFERRAADRDPADPARSALFSGWASTAADRIRHPERYEGVANAD